MTLTEFLLARIAEDEAHWGEPLLADPARLERRMLAECASKRGIVENATNMHTSGLEWDKACQLVALPYADHPDYRDEWRP